MITITSKPLLVNEVFRIQSFTDIMYNIRLILGKLEIIINDIIRIIKYDSAICILNSKRCNNSAAPRATTKSPQQSFESQVYCIASM